MDNQITAPEIGRVKSNLASTSVQRENTDIEKMQLESNILTAKHKTSQNFLDYSQKFLTSIGSAVSNVANTNASQLKSNYSSAVNDYMSQEDTMAKSMTTQGMAEVQSNITKMANGFKDELGQVQNLTPVEQETHVKELNTIWQTSNNEFQTRINEKKIQNTIQLNNTIFDNEMTRIENSDSLLGIDKVNKTKQGMIETGIPLEQVNFRIAQSMQKRQNDYIAKQQLQVEQYIKLNKTGDKAGALAMLSDMKSNINKLFAEGKGSSQSWLNEQLEIEDSGVSQGMLDTITNDRNTTLGQFYKQVESDIKNTYLPRTIITANITKQRNNANQSLSTIETTFANKGYSTDLVSQLIGEELTDGQVSFKTFQALNPSVNLEEPNIYGSETTYFGSEAKLANDLDDFNTGHANEDFKTKIQSALAYEKQRQIPGFTVKYLQSIGKGRPESQDQLGMLETKERLSESFGMVDLTSDTKVSIDFLLDGKETYVHTDGVAYNRNALNNMAYQLYADNSTRIAPGEYDIDDMMLKGFIDKLPNNYRHVSNGAKYNYSSANNWVDSNPDKLASMQLLERSPIIQEAMKNPTFSSMMNTYGSINTADLALNHWDEIKEILKDKQYDSLFDNQSGLSRSELNKMSNDITTMDSINEAVREENTQDQDEDEISNDEKNLNKIDIMKKSGMSDKNIDLIYDQNIMPINPIDGYRGTVADTSQTKQVGEIVADKGIDNLQSIVPAVGATFGFYGNLYNIADNFRSPALMNQAIQKVQGDMSQLINPSLEKADEWVRKYETMATMLGANKHPETRAGIQSQMVGILKNRQEAIKESIAIENSTKYKNLATKVANYKDRIHTRKRILSSFDPAIVGTNLKGFTAKAIGTAGLYIVGGELNLTLTKVFAKSNVEKITGDMDTWDETKVDSYITAIGLADKDYHTEELMIPYDYNYGAKNGAYSNELSHWNLFSSSEIRAKARNGRVGMTPTQHQMNKAKFDLETEMKLQYQTPKMALMYKYPSMTSKDADEYLRQAEQHNIEAQPSKIDQQSNIALDPTQSIVGQSIHGIAIDDMEAMEIIVNKVPDTNARGLNNIINKFNDGEISKEAFADNMSILTTGDIGNITINNDGTITLRGGLNE